MEHLAPGCPWHGFDPGTIAFCERRLCAWIVEPSNAWSNLAYLFVGMAVLYAWRKNRQPLVWLVGVTSILVAIGSFAFHATGTFWGEFLDISAMFLISSMFITFNMRRLDPNMKAATLVICYFAIAGASSSLLWVVRPSGIPMFTVHVIIAGWMEIRIWRTKIERGTQYRPLGLLVACFAFAFFMWNLDIRGILCDPDNHILTGHAVWHIANSACLWFFYRFHQQFVAPAPTARG